MNKFACLLSLLIAGSAFAERHLAPPSGGIPSARTESTKFSGKTVYTYREDGTKGINLYASGLYEMPLELMEAREYQDMTGLPSSTIAMIWNVIGSDRGTHYYVRTDVHDGDTFEVIAADTTHTIWNKKIEWITADTRYRFVNQQGTKLTSPLQACPTVSDIEDGDGDFAHGAMIFISQGTEYDGAEAHGLDLTEDLYHYYHEKINSGSLNMDFNVLGQPILDTGDGDNYFAQMLMDGFTSHDPDVCTYAFDLGSLPSWMTADDLGDWPVIPDDDQQTLEGWYVTQGAAIVEELHRYFAQGASYAPGVDWSQSIFHVPHTLTSFPGTAGWAEQAALTMIPAWEMELMGGLVKVTVIYDGTTEWKDAIGIHADYSDGLIIEEFGEGDKAVWLADPSSKQKFANFIMDSENYGVYWDGAASLESDPYATSGAFDLKYNVDIAIWLLDGNLDPVSVDARFDLELKSGTGDFGNDLTGTEAVLNSFTATQISGDVLWHITADPRAGDKYGSRIDALSSQ